MLKNRRTRRKSGQLLALIPTILWLTIHSPIIGDVSLLSLIITIPVAFILLSMLFNAFLMSIKRTLIQAQKEEASPIIKKLTTRPSLFILVIITSPMALILSLLFIDLISFIAQVPPTKLYDGEYTFLTSLYFGTFAVLGFSVSAYVASVRHRSLRQSEKHLEYTQQKDRESEVDRRMLEGIKLLGDKNESVRLGGIYILWEIVKDAAKALPYLNPRNYYVYYYRYKDYPIIPYIVDKPLPASELKGQRRLKERYLRRNPADQSQIKAYLKAFSLYEQVLSILCGHIRTLTNSEEYLLTYYPSIAKVRFPRAYAERYGDDSRIIRKKEEEPGNEIAILFRLLSKKEYSHDKPLVRALNFKMNLASSILKGIYSDHADLSYANLRNVNFTHARLNYVTFDYSSCIHANFNSAILNISSFTMADCNSASFINAQITNTTFKYANCIRANFTHLFHKAYFYGTTMLHTRFSYDDFIKGKIEFLGINGLPGFANCTSLEREAVIELIKEDRKTQEIQKRFYINPNNIESLQAIPELYEQYQIQLLQPAWRIPIAEAKQAHETLMRSGSNQQPGETYSGHRSLEQIKTRDNLAVFYRMFKEKNRSHQAFYESLNPKEKCLVVRMFSDFDQLKKREDQLYRQQQEAHLDQSEKGDTIETVKASYRECIAEKREDTLKDTDRRESGKPIKS